MTDKKETKNIGKESTLSDVEKLLKGLRRGECKGIGGGTAYKITQYAKKIGVYK